jgi:hypothetical protein
MELHIHVLADILSFLRPQDLFQACCVAKIWREASDSDFIWHKHCSLLWHNKAGVVEGVLHSATYLSDIGFQSLSIKEIKTLLAARDVRTARFIERSEFLQALTNSQSLLSGKPLISKWKSSYVQSVKDSKRTDITKKELCGSTWQFYFKRPDFTHEFHSLAKFNSDGTFVMDPWPMPSPGHLEWILGLDNDGKKFVRIDRFPPHYFTRQSNWGFRMENEAVVMFQRFDSPSMQEAINYYFEDAMNSWTENNFTSY